MDEAAILCSLRLFRTWENFSLEFELETRPENFPRVEINYRIIADELITTIEFLIFGHGCEYTI